MFLFVSTVFLYFFPSGSWRSLASSRSRSRQVPQEEIATDPCIEAVTSETEESKRATWPGFAVKVSILGDKNGRQWRNTPCMSWSSFQEENWIVIDLWLEESTIQKCLLFPFCLSFGHFKVWVNPSLPKIQGEEPWAIWSWSSPQYLALKVSAESDG